MSAHVTLPCPLDPFPMCAIGVDVGGTKIAGGLVALASGEVLTRRAIPTGAARGGEPVLEDGLAIARGLGDGAGARGLAVSGVGVGVAELVDAAGAVRSEHTIAWRGLPVRERLAAVAAPAAVESDVRAAALAEATYGAGRAYRHFAYVTVGTGISSCLVLDGRPFPGGRGNALVLASGPLSVPCAACGTLSPFVPEEYASGPALVSRYVAAGGRAARAEDVLAAAAAGDAAALEVVGSAGHALGSSVAFLVNVTDPEAVVVGGGLGHAGGPYWGRFTASVREHVWGDETRRLPILRGALGPDAGLIGAAAAVLPALRPRTAEVVR